MSSPARSSVVAICATAIPGSPSSVASRVTVQRRPPATCARPTKYMSFSASCSSATLESQLLQAEPQVGRVLQVERKLRAGEHDQPPEVGPQQRGDDERKAGV